MKNYFLVFPKPNLPAQYLNIPTWADAYLTPPLPDFTLAYIAGNK